MVNDDESSALAIVRSLIQVPDQTVSTDHRAALRANAERYLFEDARIGDMTWIAESAIEAVPTLTGLEETSDQDLLVSWRMILNRVHGDFLLDIEKIVDESTDRFRSACSSVFGVDDSAVAALLREFHDLSLGSRFAIIVGISESPSFHYLNELIDTYEGEVHMEPFEQSMRELMRRTLRHDQ